jgi:hypothetical protein
MINNLVQQPKKILPVSIFCTAFPTQCSTIIRRQMHRPGGKNVYAQRRHRKDSVELCGFTVATTNDPNTWVWKMEYACT